MIYKYIKVVAISAILSTTAVVEVAYAQQSYPMTCRGGGTLSIRNDGGNGVRIRFQPAAGAASQGLSPGQCTWSDRALRPGEPITICDSGANASQYVNLLVQSSQYAIVQVYNDGQSCMKVTRIGP